MAATCRMLTSGNISFLRTCRKSVFTHVPRRYLRGRPPETAKNIEQKIKDLNKKDPVLDARIDIGFSNFKSATKLQLDLKTESESSVNVQDSTQEKPNIDLDEMQETWKLTSSPEHIKDAADFYGIYDVLFHHGYFMPWVALDILYDYSKELVTPVYRGNIITGSEAATVPHVHFESNTGDLWTLILTNPDGNLYEQDAECLHWFIGNIKGNDIQSGDVVCPYLQPFPARGTGYQRMVFVLYKQERLIDYASVTKSSSQFDLKERTFKTFDFYEARQDLLTPAGLAFYQTIWDHSITDVFHNVLNMLEPVYEYCHKPEYFAPQVKYPHKQPFNLYLDRYRDIEDLRKEVLLKRLKMITPFEEEAPPFKYPNIYTKPRDMPSWQKLELWKERNRYGKYMDLRPHSVYGHEEYTIMRGKRSDWSQ